MKRRILTIQIEIEDNDEAAWIWNNHMNGIASHGVHVTAIHSGPIPKPCERDDDDDDDNNEYRYN